MLAPMNPELLLIKAKLAAASLSALFGFTITEALTNQWILAAGASVFAALAGGGIVTATAKVIGARATARSLDSTAQETTTDNMIRRLNKVHAMRVEFLESRLAYKDLVSTLERTSKHRALSECQRLTFHVNLLETLLRTANQPVPHFEPKEYDQLVGDEDRQITELAKTRFRTVVDTKNSVDEDQ